VANKDLYFSKIHKDMINYFYTDNTTPYKYVRDCGVEYEFTIEANEGEEVNYSFNDLEFIGTFDESKIFRTQKHE